MMIHHAEHLPAIRIDLKAAGVYLNQYLVHKVLVLIKKLTNLLPQANSIEICFQAESDQPTRPKMVTVRFGLPASPVVATEKVVATESGKRWEVVLKNVEKKLMSQLLKRKAAVRS